MDWLALRDRAIHVIAAVLQHNPNGAWLEDIFEREVPKHLDAQKRAWLWDCVSGVLRSHSLLQWILKQLSEKKKPTGWMARALALGLYQVLFQDEASVARAVRETVDWVKSKEGEATSRFANAILRRAAAERAGWRNVRIDAADKASVPEWMWSRWIRDWGLERAGRAAHAMMERPEVFTRSHGELSIVQDASNQYLVDQVAEALADPSAIKQLTMLDLCAAPGGKSIAMAWKGFQVTATDIRPERLEWMRESVTLKAPGVQLIEFNQIEEKARALGGFDLVWVDAPCTGSGILKRHPEIRWLRKESDLAGLVRTQQELIGRGLNLVRPGGWVVYSVCSLFREECDAQPSAESIPAWKEIARWDCIPGSAPIAQGDGIIGRLLQRLP